MSKVDQKVTKLFKTTIKSIDEDARTVKFIFSDDSVDRMGEIVEQSSWDIKNYEKNPVVLWGHDPSKAENVIGAGISVETDQGGKSYLTAQFDDDPHAELIFNKLKKGILRTVSAGFIPHKIEFSPEDDSPPVLKDNELLEVSVVAIPANPNAMALALADGSISRKDATFLLRSMKEEAEFIEKQLAKGDPEVAEKDMDDLKKEFDAFKTEVGESLRTLTDAVGVVSEAVTTLVEKAEKPDDKPDDPDPNQPEDEPKNDPDDPAKGGDEQPGADEDEFDPDAELTPELQAQIDEAIPVDEGESE